MTTLHKRMDMVIAFGEDYAIGHRNGLPWHIRSELQYFKQLTLSMSKNVVFVGGETARSLRAPLTGRRCIALSLTKNVPDGFEVVSSIDALAEIVEPDEHIWLCGGRSLYDQCLAAWYVDTLYYTRIHSTFPTADLHFPLEAIPRVKGSLEKLSSSPPGEEDIHWTAYKVQIG